MTWSEEHVRGATLAEAAHAHLRAGEVDEARSFFGKAADCELKALGALSPEKRRTYGITAVSALSLMYKSGAMDKARRLGERLVDDPLVSPTFRDQIEAILKIIADAAPLDFEPPSPPKSKAAASRVESDGRPAHGEAVK